jgi:hypothetical protein
VREGSGRDSPVSADDWKDAWKEGRNEGQRRKERVKGNMRKERWEGVGGRREREATELIYSRASYLASSAVNIMKLRACHLRMKTSTATSLKPNQEIKSLGERGFKEISLSWKLG